MIDVSFVHNKGLRIIAINSLDELVHIQHIDANTDLVLAIIVLKL
jgi:hypothetical protein